MLLVSYGLEIEIKFYNILTIYIVSVRRKDFTVWPWFFPIDVPNFFQVFGYLVIIILLFFIESIYDGLEILNNIR